MPSTQVNIEALDEDETSGGKAERKSGAGKKTPGSTDAQLHRRLSELFGRIADRLRERGDVELAELIDGDTEVLAGGLVSLTRPIRAARIVVLGALSVVEPLLAFSRIGRVLLTRQMERRERKAHEAEAATDAPDATGIRT